MANVSVNAKVIQDLVKAATKREVRRIVTTAVRDQVQKANSDLVETFLNHAITKEILAGPNAQNTSFTLGGYGNLYSFIGFNEGDDPISQVLSVLKKSIQFDAIEVGGDVAISISIKIPSREDFERISALDLPWASGKNWVFAIEEGISGLGRYLFNEDGFYNSRSYTGIQIPKGGSAKLTSRYDGVTRGREYTPQAYMTKILKDATSKLVRDVKKGVISRSGPAFGTFN